MTMSNLHKRMHKRNVPPLPPSLRHFPVPVASSNRTRSVDRNEWSASSETEPQCIATSPVPNLATPSPSEEFWDFYNHNSHRADNGNGNESATQDEDPYYFVMCGDATWSGSQTSEEEDAADKSSQTSEVEDDQDYDMRKEGVCREGVPMLAVPSVYMEPNNQLNETTQAHTDNHSGPSKSLNPPSRRLKFDPKISDAPKAIDAQPVGILWRPQDFKTTRSQTVFSNAEPTNLPPRFSTPSPPSSSSFTVTGTSTKLTREGETINNDTSTSPTQHPELRLLFLPNFDALCISTCENEDNDSDTIRLHIASLREVRDRLVEQIAGPEEREKVEKKSEEFDARCKVNEAQYGSQMVVYRLIVEKQRLQLEIERAQKTLKRSERQAF